ncbi:recombinase family protein, partial [Pseudokineococcus sp. 1T1Z-3]|uniref:recombinase family protein n=1 Tax=Pseudokineococcus sp. 1T1Z-3 TaxID=3132745 RepID=UPI00309682DD
MCSGTTVGRFPYAYPVPHALGYARVSTTAQDPSLQHDALRSAGCAHVWTDVASGARDDRPELA